MSTNAQAIAAVLRRSGTEYCFGLPGGEIVTLIEALRVAGVRFYLTGHEASAAFMAGVTGQLSGCPGVCLSTLGPGAINFTLGLANARLDRDPVLAIGAQVPSAIERHFPHQRIPLGEIFEHICKAAASVTGGGTEELVQTCLLTAAAPPAGPVYLELPSDLASQPVMSGSSPPVLASAPCPSNPLSKSSNALEEICDALNEAKRPLLMVGLGCLPADVPAVRRFVDATDIPFVVTPKAKGCLAEDAPGFLGVISGMALDKAILETLDQADLLLGVGFDPVECDKPWYIDRTIANISRFSTREGDYAPLESIGEIGSQLEVVRTRVSKRPWPSNLLVERQSILRAKSVGCSDGISPLAAIGALRETLPPETMMACDVGSHKYFMGQFWRSYAPQTFLVSNGLSSMGYAVPAAIAAKLCFPDRPVAAVVGDGGMLMMLHNLVFLRQYNVSIVVVCFVDHSLSLIRVAQERRGVQPYGVDFPSPDFVRIAEACGIVGIHARTPTELERATEQAVRSRTPTIIQVPVDKREYRLFC